MASDESMTNRSCISSMQEDGHYDDDDDDDDDTDDSYDHQRHPRSLSRLSICTRSSICGGEGQGQGGGGEEDDDLDTYMSLLSIQSFDGDIDDDMLSSTHNRANQILLESGLHSSDSDKEPAAGYYSLPATPPRRRPTAANPMVKEYASENEAQTTIIMSDTSRSTRRNTMNRSRRRRIMNNRHSWLSPPASTDRGTQLTDKKKDDGNDINYMMRRTGSSNFSVDSSCAGTGTGTGTGTGVVKVITRPKGGRRSLCMDLEEVKACRDLGFELEHQEVMTPSHLSISNDTNTTCSSGGNSPIANWRISSPGDDPREVKARIKVWAQAVALASTSRQGTLS